MTVNVLGRRLPAAATYVAALSAAVLLLAVAVSAALVQSNRSTALNQAVLQSVEARGHLRLLLLALVDAETAQRGYLITGDRAYLEPYEAARGQIDRELDFVEDAASTDQERVEVARMSELIAMKSDELAVTIELRRRGRTGEAAAIVRSDRGKETMDELRAIIDTASIRQQRHLEQRIAESDASNAQLRWIILAAGALLLTIGVLLAITVRGAMSELRASRDEARAAQRRQAAEIKARESAEDKVRQMQKMETIGQITGGVAHDFNNMLAVIMSALQLARRRMERGQEGALGFVDSAIDGARRASSLTNRLLAFARRQPLSPAVIDINRLLGDISDMLRRTLGEQIDLEIVLAGGLWRVHADKHELEQAILNICVNARDAMPSGGKLTIETANAHLDEAYAAANTDVTPGQYSMVAITDTGGGMPPEVQAQAFEPFFTTKDIGKGTGLGLSHVHGFLKQSGGHAAIYSEIGVGTTVKLYLPRTQLAEQAQSAPEIVAEEKLAGDPATIILVVEDDDRVRSLSVAALRDLGYTVLHANGGAEALRTLEANPGIALLFTDVVMPEMSGRVLADEARKHYPHLKVLYTTGYTQIAIVHNGVVDADARLIMKPYTLNDLARKVRAVLAE